MKYSTLILSLLVLFTSGVSGQVMEYSVGSVQNSIVRTVDHRSVLIYTQESTTSAYFVLHDEALLPSRPTNGQPWRLRTAPSAVSVVSTMQAATASGSKPSATRCRRTGRSRYTFIPPATRRNLRKSYPLSSPPTPSLCPTLQMIWLLSLPASR